MNIVLFNCKLHTQITIQKKSVPENALNNYRGNGSVNIFQFGSAGAAVNGLKFSLVILTSVLRLIWCNFSNLSLSVTLN